MQTEIFGVSKFKKTFDTGSRLRKNVCSRRTLDKTQFVLYLTIDGIKVAETTEKHQLPSVSLKSRVKIPPRHCAIIDVDINTE